MKSIKRDKETKDDNFEVEEAGNNRTTQASAKLPESWRVENTKVAKADMASSD